MRSFACDRVSQVSELNPGERRPRTGRARHRAEQWQRVEAGNPFHRKPVADRDPVDRPQLHRPARERGADRELGEQDLVGSCSGCRRFDRAADLVEEREQRPGKAPRETRACRPGPEVAAGRAAPRRRAAARSDRRSCRRRRARASPRRTPRATAPPSGTSALSVAVLIRVRSAPAPPASRGRCAWRRSGPARR